MVQVSRLVAAIAVVAGGLTVQSVGASAMPALDTRPAQIIRTEGAPGVEQAQFYGHPYGYGYGYRRPFYGYGYHRRYRGYHRPFFGGYGYRRHFGYGHHRRFGYYGGGYGY